MSRLLGHRNLMMIEMTFLTIFIVASFSENPTTAQEDDQLMITTRRDEFVDLAGYGEDKLSTVVITGKLLCHGSSHPRPISGASLAVFCGSTNRRSTKRSWARGSTNSYGEFLIDLPSHLHAILNLEKICMVHVLHLPKSSPCGRAFTGKRKGIKLASVGEGVRIYTTHNIHLTGKPTRAHHHVMKRGAKKRQVM